MVSFIKKLEKLKPGTIVSIRYSHADYVAEAIALLLLLFSFLTLWLNWSSLSDPASILSNAADEPVRIYSRSGLLTFQFAIALIYIVLTVISKLPPRWHRYFCKITAENAARQYSIVRSFYIWFKALLMLGTSFQTWGTIQVFLGRAKGLAASVELAFTGLFIAILIVIIAVHLVKANRAR